MTIRLLIADDQSLLRAGLRLLLEAEPEFDVVGEAGDGRDAVHQAELHLPDVVLMDIRMPAMDGIEATRRIVSRVPRSRVVILTTFESDENVFEALRAGASGFIVKTAPSQELVDAVKIAAAGDSVLSPSVTRRLIKDIVRRTPALPERRARLAELTPRELEVLRLVAEGATNKEIAGRLFVTEATVKSHFGRILAKLELRDRVHAVIFAYEAGLAAPGAAD